MTTTTLLVYNSSGQCFFIGRCWDWTVHVCEVGEESATIMFQKDTMAASIPDDVVLKDATLGEPVKGDGYRFKIRWDHNYILSKGELIILHLVPYIRSEPEEGKCAHTQALTFYYHSD